MAAIQSLQAINAGEGVEKKEPSYTVGGNAKLVQPLWRTVWRFLKKLSSFSKPFKPILYTPINISPTFVFSYRKHALAPKQYATI